MDFNKLTTNSQQALAACRTILEKYEHSALDPEHILISLIEQTDGIVSKIFDEIGVSKKRIVDKSFFFYDRLAITAVVVGN